MCRDLPAEYDDAAGVGLDKRTPAALLAIAATVGALLVAVFARSPTATAITVPIAIAAAATAARLLRTQENDR